MDPPYLVVKVMANIVLIVFPRGRQFLPLWRSQYRQTLPAVCNLSATYPLLFVSISPLGLHSLPGTSPGPHAIWQSNLHQTLPSFPTTLFPRTLIWCLSGWRCYLQELPIFIAQADVNASLYFSQYYLTCKFFKVLDSILGHRPASIPAALLDTGTGSSTVEYCTEETNNW